MNVRDTTVMNRSLIGTNRLKGLPAAGKDDDSPCSLMPDPSHGF